MISDLTQRYGPVVRQAKVVGVLDAAFDVIVPEFGIEKRVHIDQIPIDVGPLTALQRDGRLTKPLCTVEPRLRSLPSHTSDLLVGT